MANPPADCNSPLSSFSSSVTHSSDVLFSFSSNTVDRNSDEQQSCFSAPTSITESTCRIPTAACPLTLPECTVHTAVTEQAGTDANMTPSLSQQEQEQEQPCASISPSHPLPVSPSHTTTTATMTPAADAATTSTTTMAHEKLKNKSVTLLDLPTEILEQILCHLICGPKSFIQSCRQIHRLSQSPFLRAQFLWGFHGGDQVLTRKTVEGHKLTSSIINANVVSFLIAKGASFRDPTEFIFRWACAKGCKDLVIQILQCQPRLDLKLNHDWSLREAAQNGCYEIATVLLQQPDYVPSEYGLNKAFEVAYSQSHYDTVKALLDYAQDRGAQLEQESSVFHSATPATRRAKLVLAGGLLVQKDEDRALRYAVLGNDLRMVQLLLDYGANVHAFRENAAEMAAQKGHTEILRVLLQAGADMEVFAGGSLRTAAEEGAEEIVRTLCEYGADPMWGSCSALRKAANKGHDRILEILLDYGADVNIHEGTPLQVACQRGHEAAVRVLLRYGANHRLDDGAAYKSALEANHENILALLIQAETKMRTKEQELERLLRQQAFSNSTTASSLHTRSMSEFNMSSFAPSTVGQLHHYNAFEHTMASSSAAGSLASSSINSAVATAATADTLARGHKRFYSQMSNVLTVADLFRSGSVCGLVALDDEIRFRQRSESNRL